MALYRHQDATLGDLKGSGYLFTTPNTPDDEYKGIFYGPSDESEALEALVEQDPVVFSGTLYKKNRSGGVSSTRIEVQVDVVAFRSVSMGEQAVLSASV